MQEQEKWTRIKLKHRMVDQLKRSRADFAKKFREMLARLRSPQKSGQPDLDAALDEITREHINLMIGSVEPLPDDPAPDPRQEQPVSQPVPYQTKGYAPPRGRLLATKKGAAVIMAPALVEIVADTKGAIRAHAYHSGCRSRKPSPQQARGRSPSPRRRSPSRNELPLHAQYSPRTRDMNRPPSDRHEWLTTIGSPVTVHNNVELRQDLLQQAAESMFRDVVEGTEPSLQVAVRPNSGRYHGGGFHVGVDGIGTWETGTTTTTRPMRVEGRTSRPNNSPPNSSRKSNGSPHRTRGAALAADADASPDQEADLVQPLLAAKQKQMDDPVRYLELPAAAQRPASGHSAASPPGRGGVHGIATGRVAADGSQSLPSGHSHVGTEHRPTPPRIDIAAVSRDSPDALGEGTMSARLPNKPRHIPPSPLSARGEGGIRGGGSSAQSPRAGVGKAATPSDSAYSNSSSGRQTPAAWTPVPSEDDDDHVRQMTRSTTPRVEGDGGRASESPRIRSARLYQRKETMGGGFQGSRMSQRAGNPH
ncbi:hypothetical protein CYMTET_49982 [Cymbomonas tetramitiformis]|uniref:Uncharacterized protein n=1 Tax=Cymbomonas tetramitiformis TaxID=36881 RepID=A0AAE0EU59_9CHLO|nr:hypothetical protein CYMTET_49982 [Cymbomonas tetramitiformis]